MHGGGTLPRSPCVLIWKDSLDFRSYSIKTILVMATPGYKGNEEAERSRQSCSPVFFHYCGKRGEKIPALTIVLYVQIFRLL